MVSSCVSGGRRKGLSNLSLKSSFISISQGCVCQNVQATAVNLPTYLALHSGCDGGDDAGLGLASEGVPQKPCELGVTVRDVARVLYQRGDDATQGQQTLEWRSKSERSYWTYQTGSWRA